MSDEQKKPDNNNQQPTRKFNWANIAIILIAAIFLFSMIYSVNGCSNKIEEITYSEAYDQFITKSDEISNKSDLNVVGTPSSDSSPNGSYRILITTSGSSSTKGVYFFTTLVQYNDFMEEANAKGYKCSYAPGSTFNLMNFIFYLSMAIGVIFIIVILVRTANQNNSGMNSTMDFTKSKAKLNRMKTTTFADVAGLDEEKQELEEIVDFLKNPKKYEDMGARVPRGVLLYGKPGTGKTLLARAVAGEAGVPFYYATGSDFVEMFVGVGASRVRDMFKTAKKNAPSILFIDEIDAVGRQRGAGLGGGNDEREQTLNQILVEMDGFNPDTNVIVMAATNRPDVLDPALLRPGRFDRQIDVSVPDVKGREAILKVHARNKKLGPDVDFAQIAHATPGFTGADLENVMNESALLAARENSKVITQAIIGEAIDRVMMGPAKKSRVISKKEREIVAYHESGHCVIGTILSDAEVVQKVTIIPRGEAGGYNLMGPKDEEMYLRTKDQLMEQITGLLGGRTAEELIFGEVTTGASNDMVQATNIARSMVTEWGMSKLGPIAYEQNDGYVFLGRDYTSNKNFSDTVAHEIDEEIREIVGECHNRAAKILSDNIDKLKAIAHYLLITETLVKVQIDEIMSTGHLKSVDEQGNNEAMKSLGTNSDTPVVDNTKSEEKESQDSSTNQTSEDKKE